MATKVDARSTLDSRLTAVKSVLPEDAASLLVDAVQSTHTTETGPSAIILQALQELENNGKLTPKQIASLKLADQVAEITGDNIGLVRAIDSDEEVSSLREFALRYQAQAIANKVDPTTNEPSEEDEATARSITKRLFEVEPTATVEGLVKSDQLLLQDPTLKTGVLSVLGSKSDFNISTTPITSAVVERPELLANIPMAKRDSTIQEIKALQRVQAIAPAPEAIPVLMERNLTTAGTIAASSEANIVSALSISVGSEVAKSIYMTAKDITLRNESILMSILGSVQGTGLKIIDGPVNTEARRLKIKEALKSKGIVSPNFESLFESNDQCVCDECTTVYSMSSYLCDILQYLRNNSGDPTTLSADTSKAGTVSIQGTVLEKFLSRRPDIADLELSCDNTNTTIPYIDLANEVMESFIVHLETYTSQPLAIRQSKIDAQNVSGESSSDLTSQPQHTNFDAYARMASAVYPFTLPYHQAIDAQRIFLEFLDIDRVSLLNNFRSGVAKLAESKYPVDDQHLRDIQREILDRQVDAESLGMVQEEYIILTGESFWPKEYFDLIEKTNMTQSEYSTKIGVKPIQQYYGYADVASLQNADNSAQFGLKYVKAQFLKRTGISWEDLVEIVQTSFVNPGFPKGRDKEIMNSLQFSYAFLQTLVDPHATGWRRYIKVADFLIKTRLPSQWPTEDDCECECKCGCMCEKYVRDWIYAKFEALGNVIVLNSNQSPELEMSGYLTHTPQEDPDDIFTRMPNNSIGMINADGTVTDSNGKVIGSVDIDSRVLLGSATDQRTLAEAYPNWTFILVSNGTYIAFIDQSNGCLVKSSPAGKKELVQWQLDPNLGGTCNIGSMTLSHLDGTNVTLEEFDRIQKFIRLWKRLEGWTIAEVDMGITGSDSGLAILTPASSTSDPVDDNSEVVGLEGFTTSTLTYDDYTMARKRPPVKISQITPTTMHRLSCIKSIASLSRLSIEQVLTFWSPLPSRGTNSLYWKLFFTRNLPGNKTLFKPDSAGDYFAGAPVKISDNALIIMAAFNLKTSDLGLILSEKLLGVSDLLAMDNLTKIYRCTLLAKILSIQIKDLTSVFHVFGKPLDLPETFLTFLQDCDLIDQSGILFPQLEYALNTMSAADSSFGPNRKLVLRTSKTLYDGLREIEALHRDLTNTEEALLEVVKEKASLVFGTNIVSKIESLLEGTSVYTTNAPGDLSLYEMSPALKKKLKYAKNNKEVPMNLQVTGILTLGELEEARALVDMSKLVPQDHAVGKSEREAADTKVNGWIKAIDRLIQQPKNFFVATLSSIFSSDEGSKILLAGDIPLPSSDELNNLTSTSAPAADGKTAAEKRFYFVQGFLPFLRKRLSDVFIVDTLEPILGYDRELLETLLGILTVRSANLEKSALHVIRDISLKPDGLTAVPQWNGYLVPPTTDNYMFSVTSDRQPSLLFLDGRPIAFDIKSEDPTNLWYTSAVKLTAGTLYSFVLNGITPDGISWKDSTSLPTIIPSSAVLPDYSNESIFKVFNKLFKLSTMLNPLHLTPSELKYLDTQRAHFDVSGTALDFNNLTFPHWKLVKEYVDLRDSLPSDATSNLVDLFNWAANCDDTSKATEALAQLPQKIADSTSWNLASVAEAITKTSFTTPSPSEFRNATILSKLKKLFDLSKKANVQFDLLFQWAKPHPPSQYWKFHDNAVSIQQAARSRLDPDSWNLAVRPLNDKLREHQRGALINYLLVQDVIMNQNHISESDGLFEFFLIDVQMAPLVETSRIKQAVSTVQTYVQRCHLGLEVGNGVDADILDRSRWNWMKNYRVWEANRKIFLYPENWIDPALRDDKSEIFKNFEGDLLQKELTKDGISAALRKYAYAVAEIANLIAIGIYAEPTHPTQIWCASSKIHIFARTRLAPFKYYYRLFDIRSNSWFPWQDMGIEIPHYIVDDKYSEGDPQPTFGNVGNHLIPIVWQNRLLVFIPQMIKKLVPPDQIWKLEPESTQNTGSTGSTDGTKGTEGTKGANSTDKLVNSGELATFGDMAILPVDSTSKPGQCWDIKMSWTEFKDGRWSPRQVTTEGFTTPFSFAKPTPYKNAPYPVDSWLFVPALNFLPPDYNQPTKVTILVYQTQNPTEKVAEFEFTGGQLLYKKDAIRNCPNIINRSERSFPTSFTYQKLAPGSPTVYSVLRSFQGYIAPSESGLGGGTTQLLVGPSIIYPDPGNFQSEIVVQAGGNAVPFYHKSAPDIMDLFMSTTNLEEIFGSLGKLPQADFDNEYGVTGTIADNSSRTFNELSRPYSLYNWELGLHAPMSLIDHLLKSQQFDDALAICHLLFNPAAPGKATDISRFWRFPPFRSIQNQSLDQLFIQVLQPNQPNDQVTAWRNNPFSPHVVARERPTAYMKWIVMKYIEILIAYGDHYFRMNSLESIPNAIQMYILASHLYGPRGHKIKRRDNYKPQTYMNLLSKFDAFSNAMVELEEAFPFSNQTPLPIGVTPQGDAEAANIFGFANTLYFAIPGNPVLTALGEKIDDRLFKIRHSQDINGVTRMLPLFEPPIDPALLVQATAMGLSIGSVLNDLNSPMPSCRFQFMLDRALELSNELKSFGNALVSARERKDNEALSILHAQHDNISQSLIMELKKLALDDAQKALEAQQYARKRPVYTLQHYLSLIGADPGAVPSMGTEFQELANIIEKPIDQEGLKLTPYEKEEWEKSDKAQAIVTAVSAIELTAGIFFLLPKIAMMGAPLGVGTEVDVAGKNIGQAIEVATKSMNLGASVVRDEGDSAARKGHVLQSMQDRIMQANVAGYEITSIDKQILSSKIRIDIANREITNQQKTIDQAKDVEEFLKSKYSNVEMYTWMEGNIRNLFYQIYTQAYDLAKQAENAYKFERPQDTTPYVQNGYWDPARDGVLSGEKLYLSLKQLQAAYQSKRGHDYEISKHVSLRHLSPLALISLRETGTCEFNIPEMLYDMDFPGHYLRRIKSVSITIPCVVGPCTSINSTLRLTSHKYRTDPSTAQSYKEIQSIGSTDPRFSTVYIPMQSIAVSSADNDPGLFELNFRDERYNPFEGAGAISSWKLDLPQHVRQFAYETITDVVLHIQYTSLDGGDKLKSAAMNAVTDTITSISSSEDGLHAIFDLKNEFATGWSQLLGSEAAKSDGRVLQVPNLNERLPILTRGRTCTAVDIQVLSDKDLPPLELGILRNGEVDGDSVVLGKGKTQIEKVSVYGAEGQNLKIGSWGLKIGKGEVDVSRVWMLVRYTLEKVK